MIIKCYKCNRKVIPTEDNKCPSCQFDFDMKVLTENIEVTESEKYNEQRILGKINYHLNYPGIFSAYFLALLYILLSISVFIIGSILLMLLPSFWGLFIVGPIFIYSFAPIQMAQIVFQDSRNKAAKQIINKIINKYEPVPKFVLFLRPFYLKENARVKPSLLNPFYEFLSEIQGPFLLRDNNGQPKPTQPILNPLTAILIRPKYRRLDLEENLQKTFTHYLLFVGMGRLEDDNGAGKIETNDINWRDKIRILINKSSFIISIPSFCEGSFWELEFLKLSGNILKTVFIMPPQEYFNDSFNMQEEWAKTTGILKGIGVFIPNYRNSGMIFTLNKYGQADRFGYPYFKKINSLRIAILNLLSINSK